jgi:YVTN family beta-propeller protein
MLRPIDPATGEDVPGFEPIDIVQAVSGVLSPDQRTLFTVNALSGSAPGVGLQAIDLDTWSGRLLASGVGHGWGQHWLPDGSAVVSFRGGGPAGVEVLVIPVDGSEYRSVTRLDFSISSSAVTPDGRTLFVVGFDSPDGYTTDNEAFTAAVDLATGDVQRISVPGLLAGQLREDLDSDQIIVGYAPAIAVSPDGSTAFVAHAESLAITAIDTATNQVIRTESVERPRSTWQRLRGWLGGLFVSEAEAKGIPSIVRQLEVTPDGRFLLIGGTESERCTFEQQCMENKPSGVRVIDSANFEQALFVPDTGSFKVSADGRFLAGIGMWQGPPVEDDWLTLYGSGITIVDLQAMEVAGRFDESGRYAEVVISADSRYALFLGEGPGLAEARSTQTICKTGCQSLTIVDLGAISVVSSKPLDASWATLIGP